MLLSCLIETECQWRAHEAIQNQDFHAISKLIVGSLLLLLDLMRNNQHFLESFTITKKKKKKLYIPSRDHSAVGQHPDR